MGGGTTISKEVKFLHCGHSSDYPVQRRDPLHERLILNHGLHVLMEKTTFNEPATLGVANGKESTAEAVSHHSQHNEELKATYHEFCPRESVRECLNQTADVMETQ